MNIPEYLFKDKKISLVLIEKNTFKKSFNIPGELILTNKITKLPNNNFLIYQTEDGKTAIEVRLYDETVWLTQKLMAKLFQTTVQNINLHLKNIFKEGELYEVSTIKDFLIVQKEGTREIKRNQKCYNLDAIISVGYRIKSHVATRFRQWATQRLREYIIKGFVLDDERLKNPDKPFDYFDELLRRIQDIRTSEKRFYQKITDIYATSIDYDPTLDISMEFYKAVQNKMHWAITGKTAAEIIIERTDSNKPNMGLTNWRGVKVRKQDVTIAKNYLNEDELVELNNLVEQYLIFAEGQAIRRIPMTMKDWIKKLNGFLQLNERNILEHAGSVSHLKAKEKAENENNKFHKKWLLIEKQKADKEFEKMARKLFSKKKDVK